MPQGKCAFCGTFVTSGGTAMGKHSVACAACTPLAMKWLAERGLVPVAAAVPAEGDQPSGGEAPAAG